MDLDTLVGLATGGGGTGIGATLWWLHNRLKRLEHDKTARDAVRADRKERAAKAAAAAQQQMHDQQLRIAQELRDAMKGADG